MGHQFHFDPATYLDTARAEVPDYDRLQAEVAAATAGVAAGRILELGTGTGETARHVLERHPAATLVGIDESEGMLAVARTTLADRAQHCDLHVQRLEEELPAGPFDLVVSALAVHHLDGPGKADLFRRVAAVLGTGARFVLGDLVVPDDPDDAVTPIDGAHDTPSSLADQLTWLHDAGFDANVAWSARDLVVIAATRT